MCVCVTGPNWAGDLFRIIQDSDYLPTPVLAVRCRFSLVVLNLAFTCICSKLHFLRFVTLLSVPFHAQQPGKARAEGSES